MILKGFNLLTPDVLMPEIHMLKTNIKKNFQSSIWANIIIDDATNGTIWCSNHFRSPGY